MLNCFEELSVLCYRTKTYLELAFFFLIFRKQHGDLKQKCKGDAGYSDYMTVLYQPLTR